MRYWTPEPVIVAMIVIGLFGALFFAMALDAKAHEECVFIYEHERTKDCSEYTDITDYGGYITTGELNINTNDEALIYDGSDITYTPPYGSYGWSPQCPDCPVGNTHRQEFKTLDLLLAHLNEIQPQRESESGV